MAVSMVSVVKCAGEIWNGECKIFAPLADVNHYHVSYIPIRIHSQIHHPHKSY